MFLNVGLSEVDYNNKQSHAARIYISLAFKIIDILKHQWKSIESGS